MQGHGRMIVTCHSLRGRGAQTGSRLHENEMIDSSVGQVRQGPHP
jgi:hypothetical protein